MASRAFPSVFGRGMREKMEGRSGSRRCEGGLVVPGLETKRW